MTHPLPHTLESLFDQQPNPFASIPGVVAFCSLSSSGALIDQEKENRGALISSALNISHAIPLFLPTQKHTDEVFLLDRSFVVGRVAPVADAVITQRADVMIGVRTADCVPILLATTSGQWVGAIHSGWRGTKKRLLSRTLEQLIAQGVMPKELVIWIGPRISGRNYEVSPELAEEFEQEFSEFSGFRDKRMIDLGLINQHLALSFQVPNEQIHLSPLCTVENSQLFPSYRRDGYCKTNIYNVICKAPSQPKG